jgi:hypothetical protein
MISFDFKKVDWVTALDYTILMSRGGFRQDSDCMVSLNGLNFDLPDFYDWDPYNYEGLIKEENSIKILVNNNWDCFVASIIYPEGDTSALTIEVNRLSNI